MHQKNNSCVLRAPVGQGPSLALLRLQPKRAASMLARGSDLGRLCSQDFALALAGPLARAIHLALEPVPAICPSKAAGVLEGAGEKSYESKTSLGRVTSPGKWHSITFPIFCPWEASRGGDAPGQKTGQDHCRAATPWHPRPEEPRRPVVSEHPDPGRSGQVSSGILTAAPCW